MHQPANPSPEQHRRLDRLEDAGLALAALRRAIARGDRIAIETACRTFTGRLALAPLEAGDADEIRATLGLIEARVKFGLHPRLPKFLRPLAAAIELQLEEAEKDL